MLDQLQHQRRGRALLSDDDEFFRVALHSVLRERNGFAEVIETSSFDDALDHLGSVGPVEIGLFDLNMVGMENWLDLSAVRAEFPAMRLVVVSASRKRDDILKALEIGAHGFIHKGLGVCELSRAIELICEGQVYVPPFLPDNAAATTLAALMEGPDWIDPTDGRNDDEPANAIAIPLAPARTMRPLRCSPRQREVIDLLIAGQSNKGMARSLNLSEGTIKFHMSAVMRLLNAKSRVEAATRAMKLLAE